MKIHVIHIVHILKKRKNMSYQIQQYVHVLAVTTGVPFLATKYQYIKPIFLYKSGHANVYLLKDFL